MNLVHIDLILLEKGDSYPPEVVQPPLVLCSLQYFSVVMAVSWLASTHTHTHTSLYFSLCEDFNRDNILPSPLPYKPLTLTLTLTQP